MSEPEESRPVPSLSESIKALLLTFVSSLYTRFEIVTTELEEELARIEEIVILGVACVFCICMGLLLLSLFIVALYWNTEARNYVVGGVTLFYLLSASVLGFFLRCRIRNRPRLLATTLAELAKDRDSLSHHLP